MILVYVSGTQVVLLEIYVLNDKENIKIESIFILQNTLNYLLNETIYTRALKIVSFGLI